MPQTQLPVFCTQVDVLTNQLIDYTMPRSYSLIRRKLPSVPLLRIRLGYFEQPQLDIAEKASADIAKLFKIEVATSLSSITDLVTLSWLSSYWPSLYSAWSTERKELRGKITAWEVGFNYLNIATTDPYLFKTCTDQYCSHKSAPSTRGDVWFNNFTAHAVVLVQCTHMGVCRCTVDPHLTQPLPLQSIGTHSLFPGIIHSHCEHLAPQSR